MISIARIIAQDPVGMKQLRAARALALPDWCIAAGFVRNRVWDHLHGISPPREPPDIDVLYYDAADLSKERETHYEKRLDALLPGPLWQVRNQARMHVWKGLPQHRDTADSMIYWLETVTAVGVRLETDDSLTVIAPLVASTAHPGDAPCVKLIAPVPDPPLTVAVPVAPYVMLAGTDSVSAA